MESSTYLESAWNDYATCYDALLKIKPYQELLKDVTRALNLPSTCNLLDVGCGTGNLLKKIDSESQYGTLTGIDFSSTMLKHARSKFTECRPNFIRSNINSPLPFADNTFDRIVSVNVLYALESPLSVLHEMHRVLKPRGEIVLVNPKRGYDNGLILKAHAASTKPDEFWQNGHSSPLREEMLIREAVTDEYLVQQLFSVAKQNRQIACNTSFHFLTIGELQNLFQKSGFSVIDIDPVYASQGTLVRAYK